MVLCHSYIQAIIVWIIIEFLKVSKRASTFNSLENNEFTNNNRSNNNNLEKNNNNNYQYINNFYYNAGQYLISNLGIMLCKQFVC